MNSYISTLYENILKRIELDLMNNIESKISLRFIQDDYVRNEILSKLKESGFDATIEQIREVESDIGNEFLFVKRI